MESSILLICKIMQNKIKFPYLNLNYIFILYWCAKNNSLHILNIIIIYAPTLLLSYSLSHADYTSLNLDSEIKYEKFKFLK